MRLTCFRAMAAAPAVAIPPPPDPIEEDEKLIRRFEPVLFLHADEKFVPVDRGS